MVKYALKIFGKNLQLMLDISKFFEKSLTIPDKTVVLINCSAPRVRGFATLL